MPKTPSPAPAATDLPANFESALAELEKLVARMESGTLSLEDSLTAHQRGLVLARYCQERLDQAEQQVKILEGEMLKTFPVDARGEDGDDD